MFCFSGISLRAQSVEITLPWTEPVSAMLGDANYLVPSLDNQISSDGIPRFIFRKEVKSIDYSCAIESMDAIHATAAEVSYLSSIGFEASDALRYELKVTRAGNIPTLSFSCIPFFLDQGVMKKLRAITVSLSKEAPQSFTKDFVPLSGRDFRVTARVSF